MPRAVAGNGTHCTPYRESSLTAPEGVLVECDPSIKAIINRINDQHNHDFIIDDIDDDHVLIKSNKHDELKLLLKEVRVTAYTSRECGEY